MATEDNSNVIGGVLLKPHLSTSPPDMSPFFLRLYVKGHATDVFEAYPQLLTEMALRLPYQVQKHSSTPIVFEQVKISCRICARIFSNYLVIKKHLISIACVI